MVEAVALAAFVFSALELAQRVYKIGKSCMDIIKDGKSTFISVLIEVSAVRETLEWIEHLIKTDPDGSASIISLLRENGAVQGCHRALGELEQLMESTGLGEASSRNLGQDNYWQNKGRQVARALTWTSILETVQRLQREISQHKGSIIMALQAKSM